MLLYPCADTTPILNSSKSKQGSIPVYQFTRYTGLVYQQTTTILYKSISKNGIIKTIKIVTNLPCNTEVRHHWSCWYLAWKKDNLVPWLQGGLHNGWGPIEGGTPWWGVLKFFHNVAWAYLNLCLVFAGKSASISQSAYYLHCHPLCRTADKTNNGCLESRNTGVVMRPLPPNVCFLLLRTSCQVCFHSCTTNLKLTLLYLKSCEG